MIIAKNPNIFTNSRIRFGRKDIQRVKLPGGYGFVQIEYRIMN